MKKITVRTWSKWNGTEFPTQDRTQLDRLARYPVAALSRRALFAVPEALRARAIALGLTVK